MLHSLGLVSQSSVIRLSIWLLTLGKIHIWQEGRQEGRQKVTAGVVFVLDRDVTQLCFTAAKAKD